MSGYGTASVSSGQGYEAICGECRDPCRLRFVPDTFPRRRQSSSEEGEDSSEEEDNGGRRRNNNN